MPQLLHVLASLALGLAMLTAARAAEIRMPLRGHGTLVFDAPEGWTATASRDLSRPPTIVFSPSDASRFQVLLTAGWPASGKPPNASRDQLHRAAASRAEALKPQSVEGSVQVADFDGVPVYGSYYTSTDRAPKPGEYTYLVQGMAALDELVMSFTVLSNDGHEAVERAALQMIKTVKHDPNGPPAAIVWPSERVTVTPRGEVIELSVSASKLALQVPARVWSPAPIPPAQPRYFDLRDADRKLMLTGWFEPEDRFTSVKDVFESNHTDKGPMAAKQVRYASIGPWQTVSYDLTLGSTSFRHMHAHRVQAGSWIELHLSCSNGQASDEQDKLLTEAVRSVQVVDAR
jgi:hypothetical protein